MDEKAKDAGGPASMLEAWLKTSSDFWGSAVKMMAAASDVPGVFKPPFYGATGRAQESWEASMKTWRAIAPVMGEPGALEGMIKGIGSMPELLVKLMKPAWDGFLQLQQEYMNRAGRIGKSTTAFKFENLDRDVFKVWTEVYEKEFRQFLRLPQLGLLRVYQEHLSEAADRLNVFEASMAEFLSLVYLPVEKSLKVMQEKLAEMADSGQLPQRSADYYKMWLKTLEGHYMTLFKSPEYNRTVARTLDTMGEFLVAKQRILQDMLQLLPVPTQREMDELYKELYVLKKRIKELEKKLETDRNNYLEEPAVYAHAKEPA